MDKEADKEPSACTSRSGLTLRLNATSTTIPTTLCLACLADKARQYACVAVHSSGVPQQNNAQCRNVTGVGRLYGPGNAAVRTFLFV